jgi:hypothetical protein
VSELTEEQKARLVQLLEAADRMEAGLKTLTVIGTVVKWIVGLAASFAMIWGVFHGGAPK